MTDIMSMEVRGVEELQRKMEQMARDLHGAPVVNAMRDCTLKVQRDAKILAPVDTGRLRASIMPDVVAMTETIEGVVGSNVIYAPYMEFGTGVQAGPESTFAGGFQMMGMMGRGRHFPPPSALQAWAERHGIPSGFLVARSIWRKGGLKPRRYLARALEKNQGYIKSKWENVVGSIVRK